MFILTTLTSVLFSAAPLAAASPLQNTARQTWTPGIQNTTQEFYIKLNAYTGVAKYNRWSLQATHTGAGLADPIFVSGQGTRSFLNGTNLQFDVNQYAFSAQGLPSDVNYARWEPLSIAAGYGSGNWLLQGTKGVSGGKLVLSDEEHDGWVVCEWFHGINAPQLFQYIKGFDGTEEQKNKLPSSCSRADLVIEYF
ncbi:hypothetical protein BGZ60DRAFT_242246 [Tricladium varicosporioides]|nr:hypothetical protein BGZ60DRAFT_242246 [Hymenoscyphus varicosporioides]